AREGHHGRDPARANDSLDRDAVTPRRGIVVETKHQERGGRRSDLALQSLDERETQIARRVVDAVEVARDRPFGRDHEDAAGVRDMPASGIPQIAETGTRPPPP